MTTGVLPQQPSLFRWDSACVNSHNPEPPNRRNEDNDNARATRGMMITRNERRPAFLAPSTVGPNRPPPPCLRKPPSRSKGFHEAFTMKKKNNNNTMMMDLQKIPMTPLEFLGQQGGPIGPTVKEGVTRVLQDIVVDSSCMQEQQENNKVTVVFAIRVPGCGQCREHGIQLSQLAQQENVTVKGVIKETGIDDQALLEFYTDYFSFPLYKDHGMNLYKIIGNEKLDMVTLMAHARYIHDRVDAKGIRSSPTVQGEGLTQGGVLIFDRHGKLCYVYYETFGQELDMQAIRWAVEQAAQN